MDERVAAMRRRHAYETGRLMHEFVAANPTLEIDVDNADWTAEETAAWREFSADHTAKCRAEREALAATLGIA
jgi:hypothetical protein